VSVGDPSSVYSQVAEQLDQALDKAREITAGGGPRASREDISLVIDGKALAVALRQEHKGKLLELGTLCKARRH
jgi:hypothetical protein